MMEVSDGHRNAKLCAVSCSSKFWVETNYFLKHLVNSFSIWTTQEQTEIVHNPLSDFVSKT